MLYLVGMILYVEATSEPEAKRDAAEIIAGHPGRERQRFTRHGSRVHESVEQGDGCFLVVGAYPPLIDSPDVSRVLASNMRGMAPLSIPL